MAVPVTGARTATSNDLPIPTEVPQAGGTLTRLGAPPVLFANQELQVEHRLVRDIEKALGWSGSEQLGHDFARGGLPDLALCERLLTPTRLLDLVMRRSLSPARIRCLQNGADLHPQVFLGTQPIRRADAIQLVDMDRLGRLLQAGCTIVLDGANVYDPTLEVACRALQWWSHELVQVNLYLTTGEAAGFELHWDDHDVIVVQLAGEKSWEVRGTSRTAPMYRDAAPNLDPPDDVAWAGTMQAGDVMHIPRGYWHQATRQQRGDGYSLHATFGFPKRTGVDWLMWLADHSREAEVFRHDVRRCDTDAEQQVHDLALTDSAVRLVAARPAGEFLTDHERLQPPGRHVRTFGAFGAPKAVVCVSAFRPEVVDRDDVLVVRAAGVEVTVAAAAKPALDVLLSGVPVDLAGLDRAIDLSTERLANVLVAEGICAELTDELAAGYEGLFTYPTR